MKRSIWTTGEHKKESTKRPRSDECTFPDKVSHCTSRSDECTFPDKVSHCTSRSDECTFPDKVSHWELCTSFFLFSDWFYWFGEIARLRRVCKTWSTIKFQTIHVVIVGIHSMPNDMCHFFAHARTVDFSLCMFHRDSDAIRNMKISFFFQMQNSIHHVETLSLHCDYDYGYAFKEPYSFGLDHLTKCKKLTWNDCSFPLTTFPPNLKHLIIRTDENAPLNIDLPPCSVTLRFSDEADYCGERQRWKNATKIAVWLKSHDRHHLREFGIPMAFTFPNVVLYSAARKKPIPWDEIGTICDCPACLASD